jgi:dGTPase
LDELNATLTRVFSDMLSFSVGLNLVRRGNWYMQDLLTYWASDTERASQLLAKNDYGRGEFTADRLFQLMNSVKLHRDSDNPVLWQVRPSIQAFQEIETLKLVNYEVLIRSDKFLAERFRAREILGKIFDALVESGRDLLPTTWREVYHFYRDDELLKRRTICDFISGMTDRYCVEFYTRLFGTAPPSIHKP